MLETRPDPTAEECRSYIASHSGVINGLRDRIAKARPGDPRREVMRWELVLYEAMRRDARWLLAQHREAEAEARRAKRLTASRAARIMAGGKPRPRAQKPLQAALLAA